MIDFKPISNIDFRPQEEPPQVDPDVQAKLLTSSYLADEVGLDADTVHASYDQIVEKRYGSKMTPTAVLERLEKDGIIATPKANNQWIEMAVNDVVSGRTPTEEEQAASDRRKLIGGTAQYFEYLDRSEEFIDRKTAPLMFPFKDEADRPIMNVPVSVQDIIDSKPSKPGMVFDEEEYSEDDLLSLSSFTSRLKETQSKEQAQSLYDQRRAAVQNHKAEILNAQEDAVRRMAATKEDTNFFFEFYKGLETGEQTVKRGLNAFSVWAGMGWNDQAVRDAEIAMNRAELTPSEAAGKLGYVANVVGQTLPYFGTMAVGGWGATFMTEFGNAYADNPDATEGMRTLEATAIALPNTIIESMQMDKWFKFAKAGKGSLVSFRKAVKDRMYTEIMKNGGRFIGQSAKLALNESVEELLQEGVQLSVPAMTRGEYPKTPDGNVDWAGIGDRMVGSFIGGGIGGLFLGGAGRIYNATQILDAKKNIAVTMAVTEGIDYDQAYELTNEMFIRKDEGLSFPELYESVVHPDRYAEYLDAKNQAENAVIPEGQTESTPEETQQAAESLQDDAGSPQEAEPAPVEPSAGVEVKTAQIEPQDMIQGTPEWDRHTAARKRVIERLMRTTGKVDSASREFKDAVRKEESLLTIDKSKEMYAEFEPNEFLSPSPQQGEATQEPLTQTPAPATMPDMTQGEASRDIAPQKNAEAKNIPISEALKRVNPDNKMFGDKVKEWEEKIKSGERPVIEIGSRGFGFSTVQDGHHKLQAYKNLGFKEVPAIFTTESFNPPAGQETPDLQAPASANTPTSTEGKDYVPIEPKRKRKLRSQFKKRLTTSIPYQSTVESFDTLKQQVLGNSGRKLDFGANTQDVADYIEGKPYLWNYVAREGESGQPWDDYFSELKNTAPQIGDITDPREAIELLDRVIGGNVKDGGLSREGLQAAIRESDQAMLDYVVYDMLGKEFSEEDITTEIQRVVSEMGVTDPVTIETYLSGEIFNETGSLSQDADGVIEEDTQVKADDDFSDVFDFGEQETTKTEVINRDYGVLKKKLGEKKARKYFEQADRLVNPNQNNIVEYRENGIVIKQGDQYLFKGFADQNLKDWRLVYEVDVTDQFRPSKKSRKRGAFLDNTPFGNKDKFYEKMLEVAKSVEGPDDSPLKKALDTQRKNNPATNKQKQQAHIAKSVNKMTDEEYRELAQQTTGKTSMLDMTYYEAERFIQALQPKSMQSLGKKFYEENAGQGKIPATEKFGSVYDQTKTIVAKAVGTMSDRLRRISPNLFHKVKRDFIFKSLHRTSEMAERVRPFVDGMEQASKEDQQVFELASLIGEPATGDIMEIVKKYNLEDAYQSFRQVMDELYEMAYIVGIDVEYRQMYFPRKVRDFAGLIKYLKRTEYYSIVETALRNREESAGRTLTEEEKAAVIGTLMRGYRTQQVSLSTPGNVKAREIAILDKNIAPYYHNWKRSLTDYIHGMNVNIAARQFFGRESKEVAKLRGQLSRARNRVAQFERGEVKTKDGEVFRQRKQEATERLQSLEKEFASKNLNFLKDSIGTYILQERNAGNITPDQESQLRGIFEGIFAPKGPGSWAQTIMKMGYVSTLSQITNALTQAGELMYPTLESPLRANVNYAKAWAGKSNIKLNEITGGLGNVQEWTDAGLDNIAKKLLLPVAKVNDVGFETFVNTVVEKRQEQARTNPEGLKQRLQWVYGPETDALIADLQTGTFSDNVKYLAFAELSELQPISIMEMPEYYAKAGNLRIFYMLKTFTIKRLNVLFNQARNDMQSKDPYRVLKGLSRATWMLFWLLMADTGVDTLKDLLRGRPTNIADNAIDNFWQTLLVSRYDLMRLKSEGLGETLFKFVSLPTPFTDALLKDMATLFDEESEKGSELARRIPFVGELYYWWFGEGARKIDEGYYDE